MKMWHLSKLELDQVWISSDWSLVATFGGLGLSFFGFQNLKYFEFQFFGFNKIGSELVDSLNLRVSIVQKWI